MGKIYKANTTVNFFTLSGIVIFLIFLSAGAATAQITSVDLCNYVRIGRYDLPEPTRTTPPVNSLLAQEVSGVTYNWDTQTLFVVGDGGTSVVQVSKTGQLINSMTLAPGGSPQGTDFYDPEGITYIGNGQFVMTEERDRNAVLFTYVAGGTLHRTDAQIVHLGTFVQNIGLEGVSYDPLTNGYIFVKETQPQGIFQTGIDFNAGTATNGSATTENSVNLFDPALTSLLDFADVFALSNIPSLNGQSNYGNLLVLSQESGKIINIDRSGNISSSLTIVSDPGNPLTVAAQQHEGLTMDSDGIIYVVSENGGGDFDHPQLWVYAPSSTPNQAPTAITLSNSVTSIAENTSTTSHIKVADINVADDGLICNNILSLSGADASFFELIGTELFIRSGTVLDFETKSSYSITINVDDATVGGSPDASLNYILNVTDVLIETPPGVTLIVSEVAPWSSGNSPVAADWFELTNTGTVGVNITGWKMDDNSNAFVNAVALNGITTIAPGESVIFIESANPAIAATFRSNWFGANPPAGLQVGTYTGSGVGLSTGGDAVNIFNAGGEVQAKVVFGTSPAGPSFPTFNNAIGINNNTISTLSVVGVNDAFVAVNSANEIGSPGTIGKLYITEVAPWSSGNSPVAADWFEVTNTRATAVDITGWKMDDNSGSAAAAVALIGITSIAPGESVIFIESNAPATVVPLFRNTWFGSNPPAALQIGTYTGAGVGLGTGGDAVNLYNSTGALQASVLFGPSPTGTFRTFDNAVKLNNTTISQLSAVGVNGAFIARNDVSEIGSPGTLVTPPCPTITVTATQGATILCNEGTTTVMVTVSGGTAPYTGTGTFNVSAGTYNYTVTDAYGCTGTTSITVTQPTVVTATESHTDILCFGGSSTVTITATGGTAPYTGTGTFTQSTGTQSYNVTDANGCSSSVNVTVTEPTQLVAAESHTSILCFGGTSTVTISGTGGTAPYTGTGFFTQSAGTQSYSVTDANGCTSSVNVTVTEPTQLVAAESHTSILCFGGISTVTITATGGTGEITGTGTFTQLAGTQLYTITDANECTSSVIVIVTEPTQLIAAESHTSILCFGGSSTVTINGTGGTAPYTGTGTFTQSAGTQSYSVTDANGCISTISVTVTQPAQLAASSTAGTIACNGGSTTVTVSATGGTAPYTGTGTIIRTAGTYTFTVTDANGCTAITTITIEQPAALTVTASSTPATSGSNGTATANPGGGTPPYNYSWNTVPVQTTQTATGLLAGAYTTTVTDSRGCTVIATATVAANVCTLVVSAGPDQVLCNAALLTASVTGVSAGTGYYPCNVAYVWKKNGNVVGRTKSIIITTPGTYVVTATDCKGCMATDEVVVTASTLAATASAGTINCYGGTTTVTVAATGGTTPYTGTGTFTKSAGTWNFIVRDATGCLVVKTVTITQPAQLTINATAPAIPCNGTTTSVTVTANGGTAPYTGTGIFTKAPGTWTFIVTDSKGCTTSKTITIANPVACGPVDPNKCYKLVNRNSGKVLSIEDCSASNDKKAEQENSSSCMTFRFEQVSAGFYKIININSGKSLRVKDGSTSDNKEIVQYTYGGNDYEKWSLNTSGAYFVIKAKHSGKALSVKNASTSNGADIVQKGTGSNTNEQWSIVEVSCGYLTRTVKEVSTPEEIIAGLEVTAMPNPFITDFTLRIKSSDSKKPVIIKMMDGNGKQLSVHQAAANGTIKVGSAQWTSGIYFAEITQGELRKVIKLVKAN